jgi:hypothetical protein
MTRLSHVVSLVLFAAIFTWAADARAAALEDTVDARRMLDAGAVELALTRIEALQPPDRATAAWAEWEGLRCEGLARLNRLADLLQRADALPPAPGPCALANECHARGSEGGARDRHRKLYR